MAVALCTNNPVRNIGALTTHNPTASQILSQTETLTDNFNDNSIDTAKWETQGNGTVAESDAKIIITPVNNTTGTTLLGSNEAHSLIGSYTQVKCLQSANVNCDTSLEIVEPTFTYAYLMTLSGGILYAVSWALGNLAQINYDSTTMAYWRIRESSGTIYWEYSQYGTSNSWATLYSGSSAGWESVVLQRLFVNEWASTPTPGAAWFDDFNITPSYSPTVALNTPADTAIISSTPTLNFTGTDIESDAIEYNAQVDTANTFDSGVGTNLVENPGFETDADGVDPPSSWGRLNDAAGCTRITASDYVHSGSHSLKISSASAVDDGIFQSHDVRTGNTTMFITPNTDYRLSGYIKTALTGGQAHIHIKIFDASYDSPTEYDTPLLTGTNGWTFNTLAFTTASDQVIAEIALCFGAWGTPATGSAWFDDISLAQRLPLISQVSTTDTGFADSDDYLIFDGVGDYIEVADDNSLSVTQTNYLTISMWIRPDVLTFPTEDATGYVHFLGKGDYNHGGTHMEYAFRMYGADNTEGRHNRISFYVWTDNGGIGIGSYVEEPVIPGQWIHITGAIDNVAGYTYLWKNGVLKDSDSFGGQITPVNTVVPFRIATRDAQDSYFEGAISDVRVYNTKLTDTNVNDIYAAGRGVTSVSSGLIHRWKLNEGTGTNVSDSVGSLGGTVYGNPVWNSGTHPFKSGDAIDYTMSSLTAGTYYWRVGGVDPLGSNTWGAWSATRSFTISTGGSTGIKVWNGTTWGYKPVKVWNGSTWVAKPVKVWNGSSWVVKG